MENGTEEEGKIKKSSSDWLLQHDFIVTIVIPSLLLVILLLVTIMIACILHRRHKKRKMQKPNSEIFRPRSPVIFASEPGRYNDKDMMHRRLFSADEDDDCLPDYEDRGEIKKDHPKTVTQSGQSARILSRQVPPYYRRARITLC
jgi:hypothetical protein